MIEPQIYTDERRSELIDRRLPANLFVLICVHLCESAAELFPLPEIRSNKFRASFVRPQQIARIEIQRQLPITEPFSYQFTLLYQRRTDWSLFQFQRHHLQPKYCKRFVVFLLIDLVMV